jgi:hypothetical protein
MDQNKKICFYKSSILWCSGADRQRCPSLRSRFYLSKMPMPYETRLPLTSGSEASEVRVRVRVKVRVKVGVKLRE